MKSERTIRCVQTSIVLHRPTSDASLLWDYPRYAHKIMHSDFIAVHRSSSDASRSQQLCALWMFVRITRVVPQKTSTDRRRPMQNDGSLNAPWCVQTSSLCIGWRWTSTDAQRGQVLLLWHRSAMKGDIERCRKASADVQWWKYERTISRHLYWNDVTLMVHSDFIAANRSTNICVHNAGGHVQKAVSANVGWCKAIEVWMHSTTIFRFQGPPFWHENYRSTP